MIQSALDRRTFLAFGAAAGLCALGGFDARTAVPGTGDETIRLRFPQGASVPLWLEASTIPGVFGTEVEIVEKRIPDAEMERMRGWGYRDVPQTRLVVSATGPMKVGDSFIRYPGAVGADHRTLFAATHPYKGRVFQWTRFMNPPDTWMWTEDGLDRLLFAKVAEPEFRIVNERLAERVLSSVG
ncbi:MAG TPA: hypothetical protein VKV77_09595 [Methylovirgula sp.]|nr:hypothetical protein [Methylovirgula sp.]